MPNTAAPFGLRADRHLTGDEVRLSQYYIASGLAENIGVNAPVKSTGSNKRIQLAASGDAIRGVFAGVEYVDTNGTPRFSKNWVSGTATLNSADAKALVYDDPNILYRAQASGAFAEADIGLNANLTTGTATSTGLSTAAVASTTFTTLSTSQVKIYDYARDDTNEVGTYATLYVLLNQAELKNGTTGT